MRGRSWRRERKEEVLRGKRGIGRMVGRGRKAGCGREKDGRRTKKDERREKC